MVSVWIGYGQFTTTESQIATGGDFTKALCLAFLMKLHNTTSNESQIAVGYCEIRSANKYSEKN